MTALTLEHGKKPSSAEQFRCHMMEPKRCRCVPSFELVQFCSFVNVASLPHHMCVCLCVCRESYEKYMEQLKKNAQGFRPNVVPILSYSSSWPWLVECIVFPIILFIQVPQSKSNARPWQMDVSGRGFSFESSITWGSKMQIFSFLVHVSFFRRALPKFPLLTLSYCFAWRWTPPSAWTGGESLVTLMNMPTTRCS